VQRRDQGREFLLRLILVFLHSPRARAVYSAVAESRYTRASEINGEMPRIRRDRRAFYGRAHARPRTPRTPGKNNDPERGDSGGRQYPRGRLRKYADAIPIIPCRSSSRSDEHRWSVSLSVLFCLSDRSSSFENVRMLLPSIGARRSLGTGFEKWTTNDARMHTS